MIRTRPQPLKHLMTVCKISNQQNWFITRVQSWHFRLDYMPYKPVTIKSLTLLAWPYLSPAKTGSSLACRQRASQGGEGRVRLADTVCPESFFFYPVKAYRSSEQEAGIVTSFSILEWSQKQAGYLQMLSFCTNWNKPNTRCLTRKFPLLGKTLLEHKTYQRYNISHTINQFPIMRRAK